MKKLFLPLFAVLAIPTCAQTMREEVSLSDPFVLADKATGKYYMTGTGGGMWVSEDLEVWDGPQYPIATNEMGAAWMGAKPQVWASEIYAFDGKYYNVSTFTNSDITVDAQGHPRRASHITVGSKAAGPYRLVSGGDETYLPAEKTTLDGTIFEDTDGTRYLLYCHEWIQAGSGTVEYIRLRPDMKGTEGKGHVMFRAKDGAWNIGGVTDGPFVFRTQTGRLGCLWTSWHNDRYVQGVAYSESGTLDGPWIQQDLPITPDHHGHGMLFRTFDGQLLMSIHSNRVIDLEKQVFDRRPVLYVMDDSGDELRTVMEYRARIDAAHPTPVMVNNPEFIYGTKGWQYTTGAMNHGTATNQSGAITGEFFENWDANSYVGDMFQERTVPNGTYRLTAAAFRSGKVSGKSDSNTAVCLFANDETCNITSTAPAYYRVTVHVTDGKLRFGLRSTEKLYKWMGIDNVTLDYYGPEHLTAEEIEAAETRQAQGVFLQNCKTGTYLNAGASWGTQAILSPHPLPFRIDQLPNGKYTLSSPISNGQAAHYLGSNGYVDSGVTFFDILPQDDGTVLLTTDGTHFWGSSAGKISTTLTNKNADATHWRIVTQEELLNDLNNATEDSPVDATFLIQAQGFGRNDTRMSEAWKGEFTQGGDVTNRCAEAPSTAFDVYQTISGLPDGYYQLRAQGFYRYGTAENAATKRQQDSEKLQARLYANADYATLPSIFEHAGHSSFRSSDTDNTALGKIPASLNAASAAFSAGLYTQTVTTHVTNGTLRIGVKKTTGNTPKDNWTVFDNFELYYLGTEPLAIEPVPAVNPKSTPAYRLDGTPAGSRTHGIVIQNGKKTLKKMGEGI